MIEELNKRLEILELEKIIEIKKPRVVFLENARNMLNHNNGQTFSKILNSLKTMGYHTNCQILNTKSFGNLPQNRERLYIVAFLNESEYKKFEFPKIIKRTKTLHDVIDFDSKLNDRFYYTEENFKAYDLLESEIKSNKTCYQWRRNYVRENKSNLCPTLTNNPSLHEQSGCFRAAVPRYDFSRCR